MILLGAMIAAGGLFLFFWYRTIAGLPRKMQPPFSRPAIFRWGVPAASLLVFGIGTVLLGIISPVAAVISLAISALLAVLLIKLDRYSANMRVIYDHYREVGVANPGMEEAEVLFHTARWRYPGWSHDRLVELVAGKDIEHLLLLMLIQEYEINPIQDWELYRTLKIKAARIAGLGK
jgi:hypothetical protein